MTPLETLAHEFTDYTRDERSDLLIDYADRFVEVPPDLATRPFPEAHRAPHCESDAYVWAVDRPDGTLQLHFAVENPQGVSAKAWAVILDEMLSGRPLAEVASASPDAMFAIFGKELSMGKGMGLLGMLERVQLEARMRLTRR
jgi:cysteine desulfuration protein SufE